MPVLADLSDELLEQLAEEVSERRLRAGEWLFREGDEAERLFAIRSGRVEVVAEGPPETLIRVLRRGDVLGELALLRREARSVSVRARRDTELLELSRERFESLIAEAPGFALGLTRAMGAQLAASRTPVFAATPPRTIAVLPLSPAAPAAETAELLVRSLEAYGGVATLRADRELPEAETISALEQAESDKDRVVLVGAAPTSEDDWTALCLREADLVLAVAEGEPDRLWLEQSEALRGCELLMVGSPASPELLGALQPREVQVLGDRGELRGCIQATARRLAGRAIGLVLSGGGARAFAHLGVYEELSGSGVVIDRIGGVSLGSIVGAGIALGHDPATLGKLFREGFVEANPTGDYTLPLFSLIRGRRTDELLQEAAGDQLIEELGTRYFCLSCDLIERRSVVHRTGRLRDAVRASLSIPGVFPPVATPDGRLLVDGGVLDNLPVATMARTGEGPVIASDVTGRMGGFRKPGRPGLAKLSRLARRYLTGGEHELPRLSETIMRTVTVGSIDTAEAARRHADLVIQPEVDEVGLLDWSQLDAVRGAGREAARRALEDPPGWLTA